jgi:hypothetical protein
MTFLASPRWRIFLVAWILFSTHFATNIVREHYPAFSLVEHGTFRVDEYQGFHSDIFVHRDGHSVIGNQVLVSALAAIPLFVFDPVLDALERHSKARLQTQGVSNAEYRIAKPMRQQFFRLVKERGLDLRFGAAAVVTTVFFMAPLTALFLAYFYGVLRQRGVGEAMAVEITFLFGFASPMFYRATVLGHNMFVMFAMFVAFALLWVKPGEASPLSPRRRALAGFFGGLTVATDYIGLIILPLLYAYLVLPRLRTASLMTSIRESLPMIAGTIPPALFLLYTQWAMYGNAFLPGQHWMPNQNIYVNEGMRGFTLPDWELFLQNLFHPGFGLFVWAPLVALALVPVRWYRTQSLILPKDERWFLIASSVALLLFCSANQYSRLQWNSGFRYLLPLVPLLFLALADHWVRLPRAVRFPLAAAALLHAWVLTVFREVAPLSWRLFVAEGVQLPWWRVLRLTSAPDNPWLNTWWVPVAMLAAAFVAAAGIWHYGARLAARRHAPGLAR